MEHKKMDSDSSHPSGDDSVARFGSKHTAGPWIVGERSPMRPLITVYHRPFGLCDVAEVYEDADALLIAAAPDLLAALQGVMRVADRKTDEFDAARVAIARATGVVQ